ncbi:MAG: hypothetical protein HW416_762 [Chloroflexi bacterium]|nr:hypothetical protein [Chloroflexota bacterium]
MDESFPETRASFAALVDRPGDEIPLAEAALLIAAEEYPGLDVRDYLARLDALADSVREAVDNAQRPEEAGVVLAQRLHDVEGFRGNPDDYYDPRNSFLNEVLDRRSGIPITLSLLYIEVGRRLGLSIKGIGLPGHFLVQIAGSATYLDPFSGQPNLSAEDCALRVESIFGGRLRFDNSMLTPWDNRGILSRMLTNLREIYRERGDRPRSLGVLDRLVLLDPRSSVLRRDRARVLADLGLYRKALRDLDEFRRLEPRARRGERFRTWYRSVRRMAGRMN